MVTTVRSQRGNKSVSRTFQRRRSVSPKRRFDIHRVLDRVRDAVADFPKAAMFELAGRGYSSVFEQLAACIISIRTRDEVTVPTALQLFKVARTPRTVAR